MLTDYELTPCAKRTLNIFLLIDVSSSMQGEKIAACNDAIRNVIPIVKGIGESNPDASIMISAMTFSSHGEWVNPAPVDISAFTWEDKEAEGCTAMGDACLKLNAALSHKTGQLKSASGSYAPVCIILSDGGPTDDYPAGLEKLKANGWFKHSTRLAIAIGNDADKEVLAQFTGSMESVYTVHNVDSLKNVIRCLIVTSSVVCSHGSSTSAVAAPTTDTAAATGLNQQGQGIVDDTPQQTKSAETIAAINDELAGETDFSCDDSMFDIDLDDFE